MPQFRYGPDMRDPVDEARVRVHCSRPGDVLKECDRLAAEARFRLATQYRYLGNELALCRTLGLFKQYIHTSDVGLGHHLMMDGYWEWWLSAFIAKYVGPEQVAFDIGANIGYYSLLLADLVGPNGRVVAVEPNPAVFDLLSRSMSLNGFGSRSRLINAALSTSSDSAVRFFVPRGEPKNGRIIVPAEEPGLLGAGDFMDVPTTRLDASAFDRVDFIKIDVEGAEHDVLESLGGIIEKHRPAIVCEVNFSRDRYTYDDVVRLLRCDGELHHVDYDGELKPLTRELAGAERVNEDWLVFNREK
jgi:FkbM family methyltransferase